jgi:hypothetical protein
VRFILVDRFLTIHLVFLRRVLTSVFQNKPLCYGVQNIRRQLLLVFGIFTSWKCNSRINANGGINFERIFLSKLEFSCWWQYHHGSSNVCSSCCTADQYRGMPEPAQRANLKFISFILMDSSLLNVKETKMRYIYLYTYTDTYTWCNVPLTFRNRASYI